jgi:hypothetical protein
LLQLREARQVNVIKTEQKISSSAVAMGISATSQSSTCENWGLLESSEFRAFPKAVLVTSSKAAPSGEPSATAGLAIDWLH